MADGAFVIDLSLLKEVTVDASSRVVTAGPGVLLGELDAATQKHGLVVPAGTVTTTGVGGLTLGGGIGHLMRRFGATADNVIGFDLVTVEGTNVRADAQTNPDLFWALRGGGGNFGIVTRFEYRAHPLGPDVVAGQIVFPIDQAADVLSALPAIATAAPRELGLLAAVAPAPAAPGIPDEAQGKPVLVLLPVWSGPLDAADGALRALREAGHPVIDTVSPMPWLQANSMLDAIAPYGVRMNLRGGYLPRLGKDEITAVLRHALDAAHVQGATTTINLWCMGGAVSEDTAEDDVAFSRAGASWLWEAVHMWEAPELDATLDELAESVDAALLPLSLSNGYSNLTDDRGEAWRERLHGSDEKRKRLQAVKATWDPQNVLHLNKNITPHGGEVAEVRG